MARLIVILGVRKDILNASTMEIATPLVYKRIKRVEWKENLMPSSCEWISEGLISSLRKPESDAIIHPERGSISFVDRREISWMR